MGEERGTPQTGRDLRQALKPKWGDQVQRGQGASGQAEAKGGRSQHAAPLLGAGRRREDAARGQPGAHFEQLCWPAWGSAFTGRCWAVTDCAVRTGDAERLTLQGCRMDPAGGDWVAQRQWPLTGAQRQGEI